MSHPNHSDKASRRMEMMIKIKDYWVTAPNTPVELGGFADYVLGLVDEGKDEAVKAAEIEARVEELESFEPFFKGDHKNCPDPSSCIGYQNAQSDYDNERDIRIAKLKGEQE